MKILPLGYVTSPLGSVTKPLIWPLNLCISENVEKVLTFPDNFTRFFMIIIRVLYINIL